MLVVIDDVGVVASLWARDGVTRLCCVKPGSVGVIVNDGDTTYPTVSFSDNIGKMYVGHLNLVSPCVPAFDAFTCEQFNATSVT